MIILKVANTDAGAIVAGSHTSAMAGSRLNWEVILKQTGAIQVNSLGEIIDVASTFLRMPPLKGRNTAIVGMGGGASVQAADDCLDRGLSLPIFPARVRQRLKSIYGTEAGRIFNNPVDIPPFSASQTDMFVDTIEAIADYELVDLLIIHVAFDTWCWRDRKEAVTPYVQSILGLKDTVNKPMAVVLHYQAADKAKQLASEACLQLSEAGFPVYFSMALAASAINKFASYCEWCQQIQEDHN